MTKYIFIFLFTIIIGLSLSAIHLHSENKKQEDVISQTISENIRLRNSLKSLEDIRNNETYTVIEIREDIQQIRTSTQKQLKEIEYVEKNNENGNNASAALDPELVRLLNEACFAVRGTVCGSP